MKQIKQIKIKLVKWKGKHPETLKKIEYHPEQVILNPSYWIKCETYICKKV